jgi:hypothetical protein
MLAEIFSKKFNFYIADLQSVLNFFKEIFRIMTKRDKYHEASILTLQH